MPQLNRASTALPLRRHKGHPRPEPGGITPGERLADQGFAALGYGVAASGIAPTLLAAHSDDLRPVAWFAVLLVLLTPLPLVAIRRRG
jgi:hypothetical protein